MKFTRNDKTNQRIERITMQHAIIGIDIAKEKHVAQVTNFRGIVLTRRHLTFANTLEGFEKLLSFVREVQAKHGLSSVIVGLEPTGHYWFNLAHWLQQQGIEVVLVNPVVTHRNKENRDNSPSKNDAKDALTIADAVSRGFYTEYTPQAAQFEQLKTLMSDREFWVKQATSLGNRIVRLIDIHFPEYQLVFKDWTVERSLASLRAFPLPRDLQGLSADEVIECWREQGMKRPGGVTGKAKAVQLIQAAKRSIGRTEGLEQARRELQRLLVAYDQTTSQLQEMKQEVEALLEEMPMAKQLQSIPGVGSITIAALLGFAGDLRNYTHGRQLLRRAGLNLAERTSGKYKGKIKLSKRGDSTLRKYLFLAMLTLVRENRDFKQWHEHNLNRGMKKMASIIKLIGKLARIVIGMIQRGETYRFGMDVEQAA
ncbi:IS110 family transposase [Paenibacillus macerans]|uniref:IS110 family transposase n=1 Tax=Paenibacillus macerans TaxID=44252 RepID=UPI002040FD56|nr:IS110 family transposase [Paenibacillus macerans]MCM3704041.1 IS110 family transposase [Paenibacillus macerans]